MWLNVRARRWRSTRRCWSVWCDVARQVPAKNSSICTPLSATRRNTLSHSPTTYGCSTPGQYDHISPTLRELHWLPVRKRITFKLAVLVFTCLHGLAPPYLATYCTTTSSTAGRSHLRSAQLCQLTVPRTKTCYGDRSFSVCGPAVWNSLPAALRCDELTLLTFRARLKAALFNT